VRILSRYLLKEHLGPFSFALGALTGLLVVNQLIRQFASLIGKGLPWSVIGGVFGLSMPFILAMTLPMAVLVAVLQTFSRLGADSEITALKASGVSLLRFVRPVMLSASLIALGEFVFVDQVLPRANHRLKNLLVDIARKRPTFELVEQSINEVVPGQLFLRAGRIDQATDRMRDIVIYDLGNPSRRRTIYADSGYIRFNADQTDLFLTLFDGYIHDYDRAQAETFRRIFFQTDLVRVQGVTNRLERTGVNDFRGDREMSLCEMEAIVLTDLTAAAGSAIDARAAVERDALALVGVVSPRGDTARPRPARRSLTALYCALLARLHRGLLTAEARADTPSQAGTAPQAGQPPVATARRPMVAPDPSGSQLRGTMHALESQRQSALGHAATFQVEIHKKYSLAFSCIVFVLIGAPVALRFPRGGIGLVIGASVVIFGFYYIGLIGGETLADHRLISPFLAMWGPNLLMTGTGLVLFLRLGREKATARGGSVSFRRRRTRRAARARAA
jgi:lipopolysaccharide export system permease protein